MPEEDNPPDFEHADHSTIWKSIQKNSDAAERLEESIQENSEVISTLRDLVQENSEAIESLNESMDWVKRILTGVFVAICITLISLVISLLQGGV